MKLANLLVIFLSAAVLISCSPGEDKGKLLAKVHDEELYQSDLNYLFAQQNYSAEDSMKVLKNAIDNWVRERILVHEAEASKEVDVSNVEQRVERYRSDLLIHELENVLLQERLDTIVSDQEIKKYYNSNTEAFQLNDYLVKVLYLKIPFDAPDIEEVERSYKLSHADDIRKIETYAQAYASNFYYDPENWIYFDDLLKEIPLQDINKDRFIMKRSKIRFEEYGYYYFLNIIDFKLKNSISPLEFERDNIKERILNTRIKLLREEIRQELIDKAYDKKAVTVY